MLLGFKSRFADLVESGAKRHTIRGERKVTPRVGEVCHCYVNPRQKAMRLLGRWPCSKVQVVKFLPDLLHADRMFVFVDGYELVHEEADQLFFADGFQEDRYGRYPHLAQAVEFWSGRLPFCGCLIHWDFNHPVVKHG